MAQVVKSRLQEYIDKMSKEKGYKISQMRLAQATGVRQATISLWTSDKSLERIDTNVLLALARFFKLENPWDLLIIEGTPDDGDSEFLGVPYTVFVWKARQDRGHFLFALY